MPAMVPIGRLRFDLESRVLHDGTDIVPLAPMTAQMLAELVRAEGSVVSASSMRKALWADAAIEDRNLNQQIYVLRRALRRDPRIAIQNVPRRGYRLVVAPLRSRWKAARLVWVGAAAGAAAIVVLLRLIVLHPQPSASVTPVDRDLTLASYLTTSEGPSHLDRAAHYYRDVVARAPEDGAGYGGLAFVDARRALGMSGIARARAFALARHEAVIALRRDSLESNALTALGIIASVNDRQTNVAQGMFDAAVSADPNGETPRVWRAKFRLSIGEFKAAGCDFRTLSQDVPTSGYAVGSLGEWLVLDRDYAGASAVLTQALDLGNHPGFARYWLARSYYSRGLEPEALQLSDQVLALYPGEASALALRLRVEEKLGDTRGALADYQRIERIRDPAQVDPLALASAQVAMGKRSEALHTLRKFALSGSLGLDEIARMRTDPDFDSLRTGFNSEVSL